MSLRTATDVTDNSGGQPDGESVSASATSVPPLPSSPSVGSDLRQLSQTIISSLQWINDFNPTTIFANFLSTNPFRRRNSSKQTTDQNSSPKSHRHYEVDDRPVARFLNGTIIPTAKSIELIELASFGLVEIEYKERGVGHDFQVSIILLSMSSEVTR